MSKTWWTTHMQRPALIVMIAAALLVISLAVPPTTAHATGVTLTARGSCSSAITRPLATTLWHEPVSGTLLSATLYGYYNGSHFCGALSAEAALTLRAGYEAEWLCLTLQGSNQEACGAGYDAKWTCLTLQAEGTGACGDLGPGPVPGQHLFVIDSSTRLENCDSVAVSMRGFFTAEVSTRTVCG